MTEDRIALVTGAARGIGLGAAKALAVNHRVVLVDRDEEALRAAVAEFPAGRAFALCVDLMAADAVKGTGESVRKHWGDISVLVNNAAISPKHNGRAQSLSEVQLDEWNAILYVNVTVPMLLAQEFAPGMKQAQWGRIINISSRAGRSHSPSAGTGYMTSKAAILGLTRSLAGELARFNITANSVAPGLVETQLSSHISPEQMDRVRAMIPLNRAGLPSELGASIAFLASEGAGFITGACLDVNGGALMC